MTHPEESNELSDEGLLAGLASILATGYLRLLLNQAPSAPTLAPGAACGPAKSVNLQWMFSRGESAQLWGWTPPQAESRRPS